MPKRKRHDKQTPRSKPAKSGASWQSSILRRSLAHVRLTLSQPQSPEEADAVRAALVGESTTN